jgi:hypothetical protein
MGSLHQLTPDRLRRIRVLKSNVLDLTVALGDVTHAIAEYLPIAADQDDLDPDFELLVDERDRLTALLLQAQAELATLVRAAA